MKITLTIERRERRPDRGRDEVLVEGSWFPRNDLPSILGNHIRTANDYGRQLKDAYAKVEELQQAVTEIKRTNDITTTR